MPGKDKIVIVGGGIGGLAAALSLLKRGVDVDVYEQEPALSEVGAGIQLGANGTRVLYALGLKDALKRAQVSRSAAIRPLEHRRDLELVRARCGVGPTLRHAAYHASPRRSALAFLPTRSEA